MEFDPSIGLVKCRIVRSIPNKIVTFLVCDDASDAQAQVVAILKSQTSCAVREIIQSILRVKDLLSFGPQKQFELSTSHTIDRFSSVYAKRLQTHCMNCVNNHSCAIRKVSHSL